MYGDSEHPIGLRFEPKLIGDHVRVTVRCGIEGSRGKCGELVMRWADWELLDRTIRYGSFSPLEVVLSRTTVESGPAGSTMHVLPTIVDPLEVE